MKSHASLCLRPAMMEDAERLLTWRNDPETRENSNTSHLISWNEHITWLSEVLKNPNQELWVAEVAGVPVGSVRFDEKDNAMCEISWTVAPEMRRHGISQQMVSLAVKNRKRKLFACIKHSNIASMKVAENTGFVLTSANKTHTYWEYIH